MGTADRGTADRIRLLAVVLFALLFIPGCGAAEPPLPSAPLPVPSVLKAEPSATPALTESAPTTAPTAPPTPQMPSGGDGITLTINVAPASQDIPDYNRGDWRHWIDADRDCQDARQEVLIAESETTPIFASPEECRVTHVYLTGPYTGKQFGAASDLDVDHMVPLANAHRSGGWAWSKERKADYANDLSYPNHLIAVQASANRQKGSKGPEEWRPPRRGYWCQYATDWVTIKQKLGTDGDAARGGCLAGDVRGMRRPADAGGHSGRRRCLAIF